MWKIFYKRVDKWAKEKTKINLHGQETYKRKANLSIKGILIHA